ncbi:MAG: type II toxin-antitoxin system prevent-host-death family antitoxin [Candidatus Competibacteraceae bacterium]
MEQHISLREANQHLSRYIEAVQQGHEIIITRRGQPVARLVGITSKKVLSIGQQEARKRSLERMNRGYPLGGQPISRNELYER